MPTKPNGRAGRARPRQQDLINGRAIRDLEVAAADYVEIRDQRIALNQSEAALKTKLLGLMKKHGKTSYDRGGVSIDVVTEQETVKVRVKRTDDDDEPADDVATDEADA